MLDGGFSYQFTSSKLNILTIIVFSLQLLMSLIKERQAKVGDKIKSSQYVKNVNFIWRSVRGFVYLNVFYPIFLHENV